MRGRSGTLRSRQALSAARVAGRCSSSLGFVDGAPPVPPTARSLSAAPVTPCGAAGEAIQRPVMPLPGPNFSRNKELVARRRTSWRPARTGRECGHACRWRGTAALSLRFDWRWHTPTSSAYVRRHGWASRQRESAAASGRRRPGDPASKGQSAACGVARLPERFQTRVRMPPGCRERCSSITLPAASSSRGPGQIDPLLDRERALTVRNAGGAAQHAGEASSAATWQRQCAGHAEHGRRSRPWAPPSRPGRSQAGGPSLHSRAGARPVPRLEPVTPANPHRRRLRYAALRTGHDAGRLRGCRARTSLRRSPGQRAIGSAACQRRAPGRCRGRCVRADRGARPSAPGDLRAGEAVAAEPCGRACSLRVTAVFADQGQRAAGGARRGDRCWSWPPVRL